MILTFAKLQRLSGLTKPTAIRNWLKSQGVHALATDEVYGWSLRTLADTSSAGVNSDG